jgi:hypothetical protein
VQVSIDFVILEISEDDNLSIIIGRPFLNTVGYAINSTKGEVIFNVKGREHAINFPKNKSRDPLKSSVNTLSVMAWKYCYTNSSPKT